MLTRDQVLHIAALSRLSLTEEEITFYQGSLSRVLDYVKELNTVDTHGIQNVRHTPTDAVAFRGDKAFVFSSQFDLLSNAPATEAGSFALPPVRES